MKERDPRPIPESWLKDIGVSAIAGFGGWFAAAEIGIQKSSSVCALGVASYFPLCDE